MPSRHERIERKAKALKRLDPEREVALEDVFTNHVADAIRASSPRECQLEIYNAIEAYEDALNRALYQVLDKHIANEDSSLA
jgi:chromatin segregation and condensation protein Rec8/ScpA/Scc1 (kleisin family)